jgi:hypothetical protein
MQADDDVYALRRQILEGAGSGERMRRISRRFSRIGRRIEQRSKASWLLLLLGCMAVFGAVFALGLVVIR